MLLLAIVALGLPLALSLRDRVDSEVRSQARGQAEVVAVTAAGLLSRRDEEELQSLASRAGASVRGRVLVVNSRGSVLADSAGLGLVGESYANRPEIAAALRGDSNQDRRRSDTLGEDILATAVPIERDGRTVGAVRVTQSVDAVGRAVRRTLAGLAVIAAVVLLLGLAAGVLIARQLARPLSGLEETARDISAGNLSSRAAVEGTSEQRSLAGSFNQMTDRLERALRSQREFVADASHQLRTPLTGLRLRLEEAQATSSKQESDAEVESALGEVDRLAHTVDELLLLSRAGERDAPGEQVDLVETGERAVERWRGAAGDAGIEIALEEGPAATAWCAPSDLDRALDVLIENAVSYSSRGGSVSVRATRDGLEVADTGPGLEPGEEERVFERFHRGSAGRAVPSGSGLGLPIARELMRRWGGTATIANRPGGGGAVAKLRLGGEDGFTGSLPSGS